MYLVWNKQMKKLLINFTSENVLHIYLVFSAKLTKMVAHSNIIYIYKNCKTHYTVEVLAIEAGLGNLQSCKALFGEKCFIAYQNEINYIACFGWAGLEKRYPFK